LKKLIDTEFLYASSRIRAIERNLLTAETFRKMAEAAAPEEAFKAAADSGICSGYGPEDYEAAISASLKDAYALAEELLKDKKLVGLFRLKYDAHNLKVLVKSRAAGKDAAYLLSDLGTVPAEKLAEHYAAGSMQGVAPQLKKAAEEAADYLAKTKDPRMADILIDRGAYEALADQAKDYQNDYLHAVVDVKADVTNIRTLVRIKRMGADPGLMKQAAVKGGTFEAQELEDAAAKSWDEIFAFIRRSPYAKSLEPAFEDIKKGERLTRFEKLCDGAEMEVLKKAHYIPFGAEPVLAWLLAKENEAQCLRIVLSGKKSGLAPETIMERLRDAYAQ
jgi:V/A-type H+-transporting ATPase subunit C